MEALLGMTDHVILGLREGYGQEIPVGLSVPDRRQHLDIIGGTGTGKSNLLRNLILQDIEAGRGVGVIDPHGDLSGEELLDFIPKSRVADARYFDPSHIIRIDGEVSKVREPRTIKIQPNLAA